VERLRSEGERPCLAAVQKCYGWRRRISHVPFQSIIAPGCPPPHRLLKAVNIGTPALPSSLNPSTGLSHHPSSFLLCSQPYHMMRHQAQHLHPSYILAAGHQIFLTSFVGIFHRLLSPMSTSRTELSSSASSVSVRSLKRPELEMGREVVCPGRSLTSLIGEVFSPHSDEIMAIVCPRHLWPVIEDSQS
jgi:hypothetical protein